MSQTVDDPVTPIGSQGITPEVIVQHIAKDAPKMREIYIIAISKDGDVWQYLSGDPRGMCLAAAVLQEHALKAAQRNR